jgi:hypothetical protein
MVGCVADGFAKLSETVFLARSAPSSTPEGNVGDLTNMPRYSAVQRLLPSTLQEKRSLVARGIHRCLQGMHLSNAIYGSWPRLLAN